MIIKKLCFMFFLLLSLSNIASINHFPKGTIFNGTIKTENSTSCFSKTPEDEFLKECDYWLYAKDVNYGDKIKEQKPDANLNDFKLLIIAKLNLISFDKNNGEYKFKLILTPGYLRYMGSTDNRLIMKGGYDFSAKIKVLSDLNNQPPDYIISGRLNIINGRKNLISYNSNPYFDIEFDGGKSYDIYLKKLTDIPVSFEVT